MEAPSRAGVAWFFQVQNSFHLERGSQHGKGAKACAAAAMGRVRKALLAPKGVG